MAVQVRVICSSEDVVESGPGYRFSVDRYGRETPAFVIRFRGKVHAYLNECGHVPAQLDWQRGEFFDDSKLYLICSVHGALYAPETGRCLGGRCQGIGLKPLPVKETDGQIFLEYETDNG